MGFFNAFKNIVLGKPVFTTPPQPQTGQSQAGAAPTQRRPGPKVIPQMYIERVNCSTHGDDMEVEVIVQNYSQEELLLDKITFLGSPIMLGGKGVSPGEEDDITAFEGDRPSNEHIRECWVYYKNEAGDYFASVHNVEYEKMSDNTYKVRNMRFMFVRDV